MCQRNGVVAAKRKFSRNLGSTTRWFKKLYEEDVAKRRQSGEVDTYVKELQLKTWSRPVILEGKLDFMVQTIRENGGTIDTSIVVSVARGIVNSLERSQLFITHLMIFKCAT